MLHGKSLKKRAEKCHGFIFGNLAYSTFFGTEVAAEQPVKTANGSISFTSGDCFRTFERLAGLISFPKNSPEPKMLSLSPR